MQFSSILATLALVTAATAIPANDGCRMTEGFKTTCVMSNNRMACDWPASCPVGQRVKFVDNAPQCKGKDWGTPCTGYWKCCPRIPCIYEDLVSEVL
ncbi:uncharacterized protein CCOS01_11226 [Colletotrichum costaricense]|uniref:Uncharacterized protein n=1 Tax=Colletotrichum costaricense TaxID=1209916 RepID=A0AAI9YQP5_9PEZI|nr:uncharacterized protein CCOS01_11226 [Colletotrichum costaricense]KAK1519575.1 hypothetical protein CCOS01_11226 [Colletotrichum costaricense]